MRATIKAHAKDGTKNWCFLCRTSDEDEPLFVINDLRNYGGWTILCKTCCEDLGLVPITPSEPKAEADEPDWLPRFIYSNHVVEPNPDGTITTRPSTPQEKADWLSLRKQFNRGHHNE